MRTNNSVYERPKNRLTAAAAQLQKEDTPIKEFFNESKMDSHISTTPKKRGGM